MRRNILFGVFALVTSHFGLVQLGCTNPPPLEAVGGAGGSAGGGGARSTGGSSNQGGSARGGSVGTGGVRTDAGPGAGTDGGPTRSVACTGMTEVTVGSFVRVAGEFQPGAFAFFEAPVSSPQIGTDAPDTFEIEFNQLGGLNGGDSGVFDLVNDSVPETCSRCLRVIVDGRVSEFLAQSGTLVVAGDSPVNGTVDATLSNVVLSLSGGAPVMGLSCFHIGSLSVKVTM